jgi:nitroreductase
MPTTAVTPDTSVSSEQVRHVVQAAGLAPSVHNTQPWRFVERPGGLELHADPDRQLKVLDPDGRQLHLSCGAALMHARVAARALGLHVKVRLLPDPASRTHLADLDLGAGPTATSDEVRLAAAILARHTHRGAFEDEAVPSSLIELLSTTAAAEGAYLHSVEGEDDLVQLEVLLSAADALEEEDERYRAELARWVQRGVVRPDGVPLDALAGVAGSSLRQRDFTLTRPEHVDGTAPKPDRPAVVVLCTDADDPRGWLQAGQALALVLLRAADHGVQAQPLGQVTDVVAYRLGLRQALRLLGVPQLVLRMGYASHTPVTPRRPVDDVLATVGH